MRGDSRIRRKVVVWRHAWRVSMILVAVGGVCPLWAANYTARQIADENYFNRDPVIGESGLVAWTAYLQQEGEASASEIHVFQDGQHRSLTAGNVPAGTTHYRPQVYSNSVAWVGSYPYPPLGQENWVLREVSSDQRDTPYKELMAFPKVVTPGEENAAEEIEAPADAAAGAPAGAPAGPGSDEALPDGGARRMPSGAMEIVAWFGTDIERISVDTRDDYGVSLWGRTLAWQKAKGFPFGWEIMLWADGEMTQLTTNFFYDMGPRVWGNQVVWYGWDGNDYEIFLHDRAAGITMQVTSNQYDDVSPVLWDGTIAWEAYPGAAAEIYLWKENRFRRLSDNPYDDLNPRIWNNQIVWQGFDGDDFEIYLFDGEKTIKLTSNRFDDVNPEIRDNIICWMSYLENWDSEIFAWDMTTRDMVTLVDAEGRAGSVPGRLSYNDVEDRDPQTAGGKIVWQADQDGKSLIFLAEPMR